MIRRLQRKLVFSCTVVVFTILLMVLGLSAYVNYYTAYLKSSELLDYIMDNDGLLPDNYDDIDMDIFNGDFSREIFFQLRYFTVSYDEDGARTSMDTSSIAEISEDEACRMAEQVYDSRFSKGRIVNDGITYGYAKKETTDGGVFVVIMDCSNFYDSATRYFTYSAYFGTGCLIIFAVIVSFLSRRVLNPIIRSIQVQKEFITNAGHELKTPVAVISANAELLEMTNGKSEPVDNILEQSERLTQLIDDLITLARVGDGGKRYELKETDCTALALDAVRSFEPVAEKAGIQMEYDIKADVVAMADERGFRELLNIFVDNAIKYCDEGGGVFIGLRDRSRGKGCELTVVNDYSGAVEENMQKYFDRFYRGDESHNSAKSGYGIGLSMARSISEAFRGKIRTEFENKRFIIKFII